MKNSYFILFALTSIFYLTSCKGTTDLNSTEFLIAGKWNWVKSEGWPHTITPDEIGFTKQITFDMAGTFYEYRNNALYLKSGYRIIEKDINSDGTYESIIAFDELPQEYKVESSHNDTLVLRVINCADCTDLEYYTKIK